MVDHAFYWLGDLTSQMYFQVGWGPFKIEVTAKMTISTPPSLPCHLENNRICNLKQWKSPFLLTSFPPFPGEVPLVVPARLTTERAY